jgi:ParB-like chromosome segregation protein Spo0J
MIQKTGVVVETKQVKLKDIQLAAYNPRKDLKPEDPEYQKIANSLRDFGVMAPLIWNKQTGNLVAGHQRLKILRQEFGMTDESHITVSVVDMDETQEVEANIAFNKAQGAWDFEKLGIAMFKIPIEERIKTAFDPQELAVICSQVHDEAEASLNAIAEELSNDDAELANAGDNVSYVIMLSFPEKEKAETWAVEHTMDVRFKANSRTLVVRME